MADGAGLGCPAASSVAVGSSSAPAVDCSAPIFCLPAVRLLQFLHVCKQGRNMLLTFGHPRYDDRMQRARRGNGQLRSRNQSIVYLVPLTQA